MIPPWPTNPCLNPLVVWILMLQAWIARSIPVCALVGPIIIIPYELEDSSTENILMGISPRGHGKPHAHISCQLDCMNIRLYTHFN